MRYAVIRMAFIRLPDGTRQGPYYIGDGWPSTDILWESLMNLIEPHRKGNVPFRRGIWVQRYKLKLDGDKISVLWARWKEATLKEAREVQRMMESEQ